LLQLFYLFLKQCRINRVCFSFLNDYFLLLKSLLTLFYLLFDLLNQNLFLFWGKLFNLNLLLLLHFLGSLFLHLLGNSKLFLFLFEFDFLHFDDFLFFKFKSPFNLFFLQLSFKLKFLLLGFHLLFLFFNDEIHFCILFL